MSSVSLTSAIDRTLINGFMGLASRSAGPAAVGSSSSRVTLSDGLRTGARAMSTAVQNLNAAINFVSISKSNLQQLESITEKMIALAERATKRSSSSSGPDLAYQRLVNEFQRTVEQSAVGEIEGLTTEGLKSMFANVGLDPEKTDTIANLFEQFKLSTSDDSLASEYTRAKRPIAIPRDAFEGLSTTERSFTKIFDADRRLSRRPDAYRMLADLKELNRQIRSNSEVLDEGLKLIGDNLELIRATGLAFLDVANGLRGNEDATRVAELVRETVRRTGRQYIGQAENLESIVSIAALGNSTDVTA